VATSATAAPRRVVLDTNVLLSALLFKGGLATIVHAWQQPRARPRIVPIVSKHTVEEFIAALRYPKFALTAAEQAEVLAEYLPYCETIAHPTTKKRLPDCRDANHQPFLVLTVAANADALVTGDRDLLALKGQIDAEIITPKELIQRLK
jgi:putative PIN family toxin of toxin-antitoxin system